METMVHLLQFDVLPSKHAAFPQLRKLAEGRDVFRCIPNDLG
jgi:hypothetical protein